MIMLIKIIPNLAENAKYNLGLQGPWKRVVGLMRRSGESLVCAGSGLEGLFLLFMVDV